MVRLRLILSSLFVACVMSAVAVPSASALEFYNATTGLLIQGLLNIVGLGGQAELRGEGPGATLLHFSCEHSERRGWIHNGLANGVLTGLGLFLGIFLECRITKPANAGCEIEGKNVHVLTRAVALTINSEPYISFTPDEGTRFVTIKVINCTNTALDGPYPVNGTAVGKANNATSEVEFLPGAPNNQLVFGGNPAELEGKAKVEMEGNGDKIEVR